MEAGSTGKISIPSPQFCEIKPALKKIKSIKIPYCKIKADIKSAIYSNTETHFSKGLTACSTVLIGKQ